MIALQDFTTFRERAIEFPVREGFIRTNASIAVRGSDIFVAVCCGDHFMDSTGHYMPVPPGTLLDPNRFSEQCVYLANLDRDDLSVIWAQEIRLAADDVPVLDGPTYRGFRGFDSARLYVQNHELHMTMCAMGTGGKPEAALFTSHLVGHPPRYSDIKRVRPILPYPTHAEKNWMPEVKDDKLRFHYHLGTLADPDGTLYHPGGRADLMQLHGGSQVIPYAGGGLCIAHGFHPRPNTMLREYVHYFVVLNDAGSPIHVSEPFSITGRPIEIVTGMALHPDTGEVMISYGREGGDADMPDQEFPFVATLDPNDVFGRLL